MLLILTVSVFMCCPILQSFYNDGLQCIIITNLKANYGCPTLTKFISILSQFPRILEDGNGMGWDVMSVGLDGIILQDQSNHDLVQVGQV
jgi:hypothetical protein